MQVDKAQQRLGLCRKNVYVSGNLDKTWLDHQGARCMIMLRVAVPPTLCAVANWVAHLPDWGIRANA